MTIESGGEVVGDNDTEDWSQQTKNEQVRITPSSLTEKQGAVSAPPKASGPKTGAGEEELEATAIGGRAPSEKSLPMEKAKSRRTTFRSSGDVKKLRRRCSKRRRRRRRRDRNPKRKNARAGSVVVLLRRVRKSTCPRRWSGGAAARGRERRAPTELDGNGGRRRRRRRRRRQGERRCFLIGGSERLRYGERFSPVKLAGFVVVESSVCSAVPLSRFG
ncbi:hypothetical protein EUGRSUZ_E02030 [Eucalyptus grandis]|uniref:Uncharacterized protein n=2 Tax=Eucalyptus grandis TaxID=71139 RepID=A0A059C594_EUCGR|nr:hypothetical protein EUGRSUZ_E02030 [Eucalyptus grandis]